MKFKQNDSQESKKIVSRILSLNQSIKWFYKSQEKHTHW